MFYCVYFSFNEFLSIVWYVSMDYGEMIRYIEDLVGCKILNYFGGLYCGGFFIFA